MSDYQDLTDGYNSGDGCPERGCKGIIEIRPLICDEGKNQEGDYAQCCKCSWNSMR